jgi:hypothetical protein
MNKQDTVSNLTPIPYRIVLFSGTIFITVAVCRRVVINKRFTVQKQKNNLGD